MARVKRRNTKKREHQVKALHPALALSARRKSNLHCSVISRVLRQTYTLHGHTSNSVDLEGLTLFVSLRKVDEIMLGLTPPPWVAQLPAPWRQALQPRQPALAADASRRIHQGAGPERLGATRPLTNGGGKASKALPHGQHKCYRLAAWLASERVVKISSLASHSSSFFPSARILN